MHSRGRSDRGTGGASIDPMRRGHGVEEFVLSRYPHLEEAYWFGEGVRPELVRRGLVA
ncbi:hypothetical protein SAMN04489731_104273 [Amycolatopsis regifaucium]|nr:hypothetical protein SAMN04489731_104273 [Amycolatopsis regifaucium]